MSMARRWMATTVAWLGCTMVTTAADAWFFRIVGPTSTVVTEMAPDGVITWSNVTVGVTCRVDSARALTGATVWTRHTEVVVTSAVMSLRFLDPTPPPDMAFIPAGSFSMGDSLNDRDDDPDDPGRYREMPVHLVFVSALYMDIDIVSMKKWNDVYSWAATNGYSFDNRGAAKASSHPVVLVSWQDAVRWCNARSQQAGLTPCYTNANGTTYRTGPFDGGCDWGANGYRLPTEAEWEKAARGGRTGGRFPWSDTDFIDHSRANYNGAPYGYPYDHADDGHHPGYASGSFPYTSPVGAFPANAYGLRDMAGNVFQWCWDWYDANWYSDGGSTTQDTRGPASSPIGCRVWRGCSWDLYGFNARCAHRTAAPPTFARNDCGFRCVRRP